MKTSSSLPRQSNMEALRILAMFFVLLVHASFLPFNFLNGTILGSHIQQNFFSGFSFIFSEALSICCVNLFILISGYFGIKLRVQSLLNFLFIILFYSLTIFIVFGLWNKENLTLQNLFITLKPSSLFDGGMWFVGSYLVLLIISPILNTFVERQNRRTLLLYIISFCVFQALFDVVFRIHIFSVVTKGGYSWISFTNLYIIGRYLSLYPLSFIKRRKQYKRNILYLTIGGGILVLLTTTLVSILLYKNIIFGTVTRFFTPYNSPYTILLSIIIFLLFTQFDFRSKWVNWIATSSFSVYLIHISKSIFPIYLETIRYLYYSIESPILYPIILLLFLVAVFMGCILIDQIRIFCWRHIGQPIAQRLEVVFRAIYDRL